MEKEEEKNTEESKTGVEGKINKKEKKEKEGKIEKSKVEQGQIYRDNRSKDGEKETRKEWQQTRKRGENETGKDSKK